MWMSIVTGRYAVFCVSDVAIARNLPTNPNDPTPHYRMRCNQQDLWALHHSPYLNQSGMCVCVCVMYLHNIAIVLTAHGIHHGHVCIGGRSCGRGGNSRILIKVFIRWTMSANRDDGSLQLLVVQLTFMQSLTQLQTILIMYDDNHL